MRLLFEPKPGLSRAHNRALLTAQGELLAFTDDDCRLNKDYVNDLLRHDAADTELVLRGGRIELGDPFDLPLTIKTTPDRIRWHRRMNSARHQPISGQINGCNMTMRRALVEKLGPFDERFGPGGPDMTVIHHHGRKTPQQGRALLRGYLIGCGALNARYIFKHPNPLPPLLLGCEKCRQGNTSQAGSARPRSIISRIETR